MPATFGIAMISVAGMARSYATIDLRFPLP